MSEELRSPLVGYNHNVRYHGRVFHVQTEDSGRANPHIFTHLFYAGTILATKRCDYEDTSAEDLIRSLMQDQHKAVMKELKREFYDSKIAEFFSRSGEDAQPESAEVAAPAAGPGANLQSALDLDALHAPADAHGDITPIPDHVRSTSVFVQKGGTKERITLGGRAPGRPAPVLTLAPPQKHVTPSTAARARKETPLGRKLFEMLKSFGQAKPKAPVPSQANAISDVDLDFVLDDYMSGPSGQKRP